MVWSLVLLTGLFLLLRLAFLTRAILPLYFDSSQHYRYVSEMLQVLENPVAAAWSLPVYYHLGFHVLVAFFASLTGSEIGDVMLVLGQVLLATMPFSLFFLVRHATHSSSAGLFAVALAAFGWYMPAHAVDWGKYPALASLSLIPAVLGLAFLAFHSKEAITSRRSLGLYILLLGSALVTAFLHSRSVIVFAIVGLAWLLTMVWNRLAGHLRLVFFSVIFLAVVAEIVFIQTEGILGPLFDPYGLKAILMTGSVSFLTFFAWKSYPGLVFFCFVSAALLIASLFVPLMDVIPGFPNTTLLDRPYVEMILYLPLSVLGGFGLAGLGQRLQHRKLPWVGSLDRLAAVLFITLVAVQALFRYDLYPSDCCAIASEDDLAAIQWLDENLPAEALILTASTDLNVLPTEGYQGSAGSDSGAWITPLTGRATTAMPYQTDFGQEQILQTLCQTGVDYVYMGKTGYFFNEAGMLLRPEGYRIVFALPKAVIYEVTGCE